MSKRILSCVISVALLSSASASAQVGAGAVDAWISGQNKILLEMLGLQLREATNAEQALAIVASTLASINEMLAVARTTKRLFQSARDYDARSLIDDVTRGFAQAFPELRDIQRELEMLSDNHDSLQKDVFWEHSDAHDRTLSQLYRRAFEYSYQSAIWPLAFPHAFSTNDGATRTAPEMSQTEMLVQRRYQRSGEFLARLQKQTALYAMSKKIGYVHDKAEVALAEERDIRPMAAALQTEASFQSMQSLEDMRDLARTNAADDERSRINTEAFHKRFISTVISGMMPLGLPQRRERLEQQRR